MRRTVLFLASCLALCGVALVSAGDATTRAVALRRAASAGCGEPPSARPPDPPPEGALAGSSERPDPESADTRADVGAWPYAGYGERLSAARHLACFGAAGVAELRSTARHARPEARAVAARKLSWVVEDDLRRLEVLLDDSDWSVRFAAGLSLFERASRPVASEPGQPLTLSAEQIAARLARGPRPARADVRRVLALVLADGAQESAPGLLARVPALGEPAVALLRELLDAPELRQEAMRMLGRCGALGATVAADLSPSRYLNGDEKREAARALLRLGCRLEEALPVLAGDLSMEAFDEWRPFVPLLRKSLSGTGPIPWRDALWVVRSMGPAAAECLPDVLALSGQVPRDQIIGVLAKMRGSASAAMPWVLAQLGGYDPPGSLDVPATDFGILGRLRYGPDPRDWRAALCDEPDDCGMATSDAVVLRGAAEIAPEDPALVREALTRLDDPEAPTREAATLALRHALAAGDIGPDPIVARLVGDPHDRVRRTAASVLGYAARERKDVARRLADLLEGGGASCQQYAARALADAGAQEALADALDAHGVGARTWAAAALLLPREPVGLAFVDVDEALREPPWRARAFAVIEASIRAEDPAIRRIAAHVAGSHYWPGGWDALGTAARDPDGDVRRTAEAFLGGVVAFRPYLPMEWELRSFDFDREPDLSCPEVERSLRASFASSVRAEARWLPVDLVELADGGGIDEPAASALLGAIAADQGLHAFERWCAARALAERR